MTKRAFRTSKFKPLLERFLERAIPVPESGCWLWLGQVDRGGYGRLHYPPTKRMESAHRIAMALFRGRLPPRSMLACHKCDTPSCVNPDHIFLGDQSANMADCKEKRRTRKRIGICNRGHSFSGRSCAICESMRHYAATGRFTFVEHLYEQ